MHRSLLPPPGLTALQSIVQPVSRTRLCWSTVAALFALSGCGDDPGEDETIPAVPTDRYQALLEARGLDSHATPSGELQTLAANLCDNDVADMQFVVSGLVVIEEGKTNQQQALDEKATVIDAFCPEARLQLEAAASEAGFELPPEP